MVALLGVNIWGVKQEKAPEKCLMHAEQHSEDRGRPPKKSVAIHLTKGPIARAIKLPYRVLFNTLPIKFVILYNKCLTLYVEYVIL